MKRSLQIVNKHYCNIVVIGALPVSSAPPSSDHLSFCNLISLYMNSHSGRSTPLDFLGSHSDKHCTYYHNVTVYIYSDNFIYINEKTLTRKNKISLPEIRYFPHPLNKDCQRNGTCSPKFFFHRNIRYH